MKMFILPLILMSTPSYAQSHCSPHDPHSHCHSGYDRGYRDGKQTCARLTAKEAWLCTLETNRGDVIAKTGLTRAATLLMFSNEDLADMDHIECKQL